MALISIIEGFRPLNDARLLDRAALLVPALRRTVREPAAVLGPEAGAPRLLDRPLGPGDGLILDFGAHMVGRLTMELAHAGSHPDAPAFVKLFFAETAAELMCDPGEYHGWLSRSWVQEETVHVDALPAAITLPRRYAFRYVRITVLDTSPKYRLVIRSASCEAVTSAAPGAIVPLNSGDDCLDRIHEVSLRTLADCMQEVFEDGPKRDRRLWLGDLRLQALTNYVSFRNNDLVKRCLYLFAGSRFPDGRVSAAVFTEPEPAADDTFLLDYALMFPAALEDYLRETGDGEALADLYGVAMEQIDFALAQCGPDRLLTERAARDCFIDWCDELDRRCCAQGVLIYALGYALRLAERRRDRTRAEALARRREELRSAAMAAFWDEERQCFVSGGQVSAASQLWMTLAEVPDPARARRAMERTLTLADGPRMGTPYIRHYYVMALLRAGLRREAEAQLKDYWGGMLDAGADTFWECWDEAAPGLSPYGGLIVNSFCHAWSCTPAYILRRHLLPGADPEKTV